MTNPPVPNLPRSGTLPATFELDPQTGEALGFVHPYCSAECQHTDLSNVPLPNTAEPYGGELMAGQGNQCCGCGAEL